MDDLEPVPIPADWVTPSGVHLQCGACGYNGLVTHYIFTNAPWCFEPMCNCPIPTTLTA